MRLPFQGRALDFCSHACRTLAVRGRRHESPAPPGKLSGGQSRRPPRLPRGGAARRLCALAPTGPFNGGPFAAAEQETGRGPAPRDVAGAPLPAGFVVGDGRSARLSAASGPGAGGTRSRFSSHEGLP